MNKICQVKVFNTVINPDRPEKDIQAFEDRMNASLKDIPLESIIDFIPIERDGMLIIRYGKAIE